MTNKTNNRTIELSHIDFIVNFASEVFAETGETVTAISYKEKENGTSIVWGSFKPKNGHQDLTLYTSSIFAYKTTKEVEFEGDTMRQRKTYALRDNEFVVTKKNLFST